MLDDTDRTDEEIGGDLLHRINEEFSDSSPEGLVEIADADGPVHLASSGGDTTSIMEGPYQDSRGDAFPTEFDRVLDMHAAANAAFPENDLDVHTQLQNMQRAAENEVAPFTCINPASLDRGNLGQTLTLLPGIETSVSVFADGPEQMAAFWPGDDREACPVTVTSAPVLPYSSSIVRAVARIKWGVHGAKFEVLVDVGTGFELPINASNVYLSLYLEGGSFIGGGEPTMGDQLVAGAIGFYSADHQQAVVRSVRSGSIAAAGTFTAQRPAFATSLLSFERDDLSGPTTLEFLDQNSVRRSERQYAALAYITDPIPLTAEISAIQMTNGAGTSVQFSLVFGLF